MDTYGNGGKKNEETEHYNPYGNNNNYSKANLIDHQQYSFNANENSYDEKTLPYPPSGVVPIDEIKYRNNDPFFVDTLPEYPSYSSEGCDDNGVGGSEVGFLKKKDNRQEGFGPIGANGSRGVEKKDESSFIKGIEN